MHYASSRNWKDFTNRVCAEDPSKILLSKEFDRLEITMVPSTEPSSSPTVSARPTISTNPSNSPSDIHSAKPSSIPTESPSFPPTSHPTFSPTSEQPDTSFSYNPYAKHGPSRWGKVNIAQNEFTEFKSLNVHENRCNRIVQPQSPINLEHKNECLEHHQIRTRRGDFNLAEVDFKILPNALRMELPRSITKMVDGVEVGRFPPQADYSEGWPKCPVKHLEIKVPSEHTIYGKQYPAEVTIAHIVHKAVITISVLLDTSENEQNKNLDVFLDEWEEVFQNMTHNCDMQRRQLLGENTTNFPTYKRRRPPKTRSDLAEIFGTDDVEPSRRLNGDADFALYAFLPTIWFFGYKGSLTVPPCTTQHWRVLERPAQVSETQLKRIQNMITNQVDSECKKSSTAFNGAVNRPLQESDDIPVWHCTELDYEPDHPEKWPNLEPYEFAERDY